MASATFDIPTLDRLRAEVDRLLVDLDQAEGADAWRDRLLAEAFFKRSDPVYLSNRELPFVLAQWRDFSGWAAKRATDEIKIRVFNPTTEQHGYYLNRTVLQTCMADQAFIFDSLHTLLVARDLTPLRCIHPIVGVERDEQGAIVAVDPVPEGAEGAEGFESMMHIELPPIDDADLAAVQEAVMGRLLKVQAVVADHEAMRERAKWLASRLGEYTVTGTTEYYRQVSLVQKFFHWLVADNYVFVGYAEFRQDGDGRDPWTLLPDTLLGQARLAAESGAGVAFPAGARAWLNSDGVVYLGKGEQQADIHRNGKFDRIAVRLHEDGEMPRIAVFSGLYTYKAIREKASRIPLLKAKLEAVLKSQAAVEGSQLQDKVERAFSALPVEFLLEAKTDAIERAIGLVVAADESQETRAHLMVEPHGRAAFVLVSLSRARYDDDVRQGITRRIKHVMGANYIDWRLEMGQTGSAILQLYLTAANRFRSIDSAVVEAAISAVTDSWQEQLATVLRGRTLDETEVEALVNRFCEGFPEEYRHIVSPAAAVEDVRQLEAARTSGQVGVAISSIADDLVSGVTRVKIYQRSKIYLTDSTPVLDHFGLRVIDQSSFTVSATEDGSAYIDSFRVEPASKSVDLDHAAERLVEALRAVLRGQALDDPLNALVLTAGLDWREVDVLRMYIACARQHGASLPIPVVHGIWNKHPKAAALLLRLFRSRFKPLLGDAHDHDRQRLVARNERAFDAYLEGVELVSDDRLLRRACNLVMATLRTNHWSGATKDDHPRSVKLDCAAVEEMPAPRPYREIFVHHRDVEGVHLRGGPVARGGLRWSDRPSDFRTEILGLMATQMVKNVLIVPVGAKGGFILKQTFSTGAEARAAADAKYKVFIRGLLDLTDNVVDGEVVPPMGVVRYDGDDPYLVVAADKGTAHLSDTANGIAREYGFWLDDAFASGGSAGYDHKKYGITAKGAWVCVRRHFRELGLDPEVDEISVVGVGDMAGDVFGNGLLLSKTAKMLAAFNHMHIVLDPDPDPAASWTERKRLFDLPRSTWADYSTEVLSEDAGIFPRHSKGISLNPTLRALLRTDAEELSGDEVVHLILKMEADLLWNGGIGTYVKASDETDRDAGDSANDVVRVDATELRFRVVGEGGNLGFTQAARTEFASLGGRINSDAVDNSGGVDMSDHEVNLKILFAQLMREGTVTLAQRDELLLEIAEQVSADVQRNNHDHSLMLSLDLARSAESLDDFRIVLNDLQTSRGIDRHRNGLPADGEMQRRMRAGEGLLRPELTRIGPFVKMEVYEALMADDRFDSLWIERWLFDYFPEEVQTQFPDGIRRHQLRKEIAATVITNRLVDGMGATHFNRLHRVTGRDTVEIAYASLIAADLLKTWELKEALRDLPDVRASVEYVKLRHVEEAVADVAQWLLQRSVDVLDAAAVVARFEDGFKAYEKAISRIIDRSEKREFQKRLRYLRNRNIRAVRAERSAGLDLVAEAGEAVLLSETSGLDVVQAGILLKRIAADSQLLFARQLAQPADARDGWEVRAMADLRANISELVGDLARRALEGVEPNGGGKGRGLSAPVERAWKAWREHRKEVFDRSAHLARRIENARANGLGPAMVLYGAVRVLQGE